MYFMLQDLLETRLHVMVKWGNLSPLTNQQENPGLIVNWFLLLISLVFNVYLICDISKLRSET